MLSENPQELRNRAMAEEQLAALYAIAAILAFANNFDAIGWALAAKSMLDTLSAIGCWMKNYRIAERERSHDID